MSDRDALADLIAPHLDSYYGIYDGCDAAIAAGWRPPARVIETADERDALHASTVIRDANGEFHCRDPYDSGTGTWFPAWLTGRAYAQDFGQAPQLPAVVVWEPEQEARQ